MPRKRAVAVLLGGLAVVAAIAAHASASSRQASRLLRCPVGSLSGVAWTDARFSPNGRLLALLKVSPASTAPWPKTLLVYNLQTRRMRTLATLSQADFVGAWSPDSTRLAILLPGGQVEVLNVATGAHRDYTPNDPMATITRRYIPDWAWSPDGTSLVLDAFEPDSTAFAPKIRLLLLNLVDGTTRDLGPGAAPSFAPVGHKIAYFPDVGHLATLDLDTDTRTDLGSSHGNSSFAFPAPPAWSPDGRSVAFVPAIVSPGSAPSDLWIIRADGSANREIGDGRDLFFGPPIWTTEGIVSGSFNGSFVVNPTTGTYRNILPRGADRGGLVLVDPKPLRLVYPLRNRLGFRTIRLSGTGDQPLLPCKTARSVG